MTGIPELYPLFLQSTGITTDSRKVKEGCLYFALKGERFDGNEFAREALAAGAGLAIVDDPGLADVPGMFLVDDVLSTLQALSTHHRKELGIPILAITGSNGKTTTKELIARVLGQAFEVGFTKGNLNNHIGVPLTLLDFDGRTQVGIVEMGANHPGEIAALCRIARPDAGLITNIGKAHLEGFGSQEGVFKAKTEMVDYLEQVDGIFLRNHDDPWLRKVGGRTPEFVFGSSTGLDLSASIESDQPTLRIRWQVGEGKPRSVSTKLPGRYNFGNIVAAIAAGLHFGIDPDLIDDGIAGYRPDNHRSQVIETGRNTVLMDAYNANPSSMEAALSAFAQNEAGKPRMVILGDMFELGKDSPAEHQAVSDLVAQLGFDRVWLIGSDFMGVRAGQGILQIASTEDAVRRAGLECFKGWQILIKGSRGMHLEDLLKEF